MIEGLLYVEDFTTNWFSRTGPYMEFICTCSSIAYWKIKLIWQRRLLRAGNKSHVYGSSMGNQVMVNQILHSCAIYICNLMNSVARSVIGMFNFTYITYRLFTLRWFNFDREKKLIGIISANISAVTGRASLRYHKLNVTLLPSYESTGRAQT